MERMRKIGIDARGRIACHTDLASGWAAFEALVLDARHEIRGAFERFDMAAPLESSRARRIGANWSDLVGHTLRRGVSVSLMLDDPRDGDTVAIEAERLTAQFAALPAGRRGAFSLTALRHPVSAHGRAGHRMNLALVDDAALFVTRHGLCADASRRDVALLARGPVVEEGRRFLDDYAAICAGQRAPSPARRLLRTLSCPGRGLGRLLGPHNVANEVEAAHHMLIRRATRQIYIETQSFDSPSLTDHLVQRAVSAPELSFVLILPAPPVERVARRCLGHLAQAFGPRFFAAAAPGGCTDISIFDGETALAGSVDLSLRRMRVDSGVSLYLRKSDGVPEVYLRLLRAWGAQDPATDPAGWRAALRPGGPLVAL